MDTTASFGFLSESYREAREDAAAEESQDLEQFSETPNFAGITFVGDTSELTPESVDSIATVAKYILRWTVRPKLIIEGHTERAGDESLSRDRAMTVAMALVANGVPERDVTAVGMRNVVPAASGQIRRGTGRWQR